MAFALVDYSKIWFQIWLGIWNYDDIFGPFILHFKVRLFFGRKLQLSHDICKVNKLKRIKLTLGFYTIL